MISTHDKIDSLLAGLVILVLLSSALGINALLIDAKLATKSSNLLKPQDKPKSILGNTTNTIKPNPLSAKPSDSNQRQCAGQEYLFYKSQLDDASKKLVTLKESLYKDFQSGQKSDWNTIVKTKLENSQEMQNYLQLQKKFDVLYSNCVQYSTAPQPIPVIPKKICADDDYILAQKNITDIDKKYSELKQKYFEQGKTASLSGQYSGTAEQYAQDKLMNSDEIKKLQESRQKYDLGTRDCQQNYLPRQANTKSDSAVNNSCPQPDIDNIKLSLVDLEKRLLDIKEKTNPEWRALHDSGKIKEDWPEYAQKIANASPEYATYQQLQQKLDSLNKICNDARNLNNPNQLLASVAPTCSDDAKKAKQLLEDTQNKYSALKTKFYEDWKSQSSAGTYVGTWDQFAQEKFFTAPEVISVNQLVTKYSSQAQDCLSYMTPSQDTLKQKSSKK